MGLMFRLAVVGLALLGGGATAVAQPRQTATDSGPTAREGAAELRRYDTKYYVIHTDLDLDGAREAAVRMTQMFDTYWERTHDFGGKINRRLPFYLFRRQQDYYAAGGLPDSAGVFDPNNQRLMAVAGPRTTGWTWHVVQHEGFHQFIDAMIGPEIPVWVNEGLAEYFGEAAFTGDGYVTGVVPQWRLERIRQRLADGEFRPSGELMLLSHEQWNQELAGTNYDQAWSVVQFLAHGDGGRYQRAFVAYMNAVAQGRPHTRAWADSFGPYQGFEAKWRAYWEGLPDNPTLDLYAQAVTQTFTSFVARATARGVAVGSLDDVAAALTDGRLTFTEKDWLPVDLFKQAREATEKIGGTWSVARDTRGGAGAGQPVVIGALSNGTLVVGRYTAKTGDMRVATTVDPTIAVIAQAREKLTAGHRDAARQLLRDVIKAHPDSIAVGEARKLLAEVTGGK